jgi:crossover junction endodeoxyribonuclease RusA
MYRGRRFLTNDAKENKESIGWEARMQYRGKPISDPVVVKVSLWWSDRRRHDLDNIKGLLDALTGILWDDDSQIVELLITKGVDKQNPRVEIEFQACC